MSKAPFDWMEPRRNPEVAKTERTRREAMYRTELEERAALLQRLGHGKAEVRARLGANVGWDFPTGQGPVSTAVLDSIVDRLFGQAPVGRTIARTKGGPK
jgi:hypothetical protein